MNGTQSTEWLTRRDTRVGSALAMGSLLIIGVLGACAQNGPGTRPPELVKVSYQIEGQLFAVSHDAGSEQRPAVGAEVQLWIDSKGQGDFRDPLKLSASSDNHGRFEIGSDPVEIAEKDMPPKALLVVSLDGHTTSYKSLELEPDMRPWIDVNLYAYEEMSLGPPASLTDGSLAIANLPDEVASAWARLFHPLHEADGISGGHQGAGGLLLSFGAVADVVLFGAGGEPFSPLPEPARLRMELPNGVWSSLVVLAPGNEIWPGDNFIWPGDNFIWPGDNFEDPNESPWLDGATRSNTILVPMLAFDPALGRWSLQAIGELTGLEGEPIAYEQLPGIWEGSHEGSLFVSANVEHFSQWGYGWPVARGCIEGSLIDKDGEAWNNVTVTGQLIGGGDLFGPVVTDKKGFFCLTVPGIMGQDQPRVMRLFATSGGEQVELESVQIQPQDSPVLSCGAEECQGVGEIGPKESAPIAGCQIDALFPNRTWPNNPLELEMEVLGSGFEEGARLVWNIEGERKDLPTTFRDDGLLVVHLPPDLFTEQRQNVKVAVLQAEALCENRETFMFDAGVLPDTGQTLCYDARGSMDECPGEGVPFYGQDAQFGWDRDPAPGSRRFVNATHTDHAEQPVISDQMTRMRWQGCVAGLSGPNCQIGEPLLLTKDEAISYCERLSWGVDSGDWRLPNIRELSTLVNRGQSMPSTYATTFPNMYLEDIAYHFWSSSSDASSLGETDSPRAWYVDFIDGYLDTADPDREQRAVLCMSDSALPAPAFSRPIPAPDEPVVRDLSTGLMWQGCSDGQSGEACEGDADLKNWEEALAYCNDLRWADYDDWRLPSINELQSIVDYDSYSPSIDSVSFPSTIADGLYWSSTTKVSEPPQAWVLEYYIGKVEARFKQQEMHFVRCTRAGPVP